MPDKIDMAVDSLAPAYEALRQRLISFVVQLDPTLATVASVDFGQLILDQFGGEGLIDATILSGAQAIDALTAQGIALGSLDREFYAKHLRGVGSEIKQALINSITAGTSPEALKTAVTAAAERVLSDAQINAVLNTGLRTYDRRVFAELTRDLPDSARYFYDGPLDSKTRPACRGVLEAQPERGLTRAEYLELLQENGVDLVAGGGWNCRHITTVL